MAELFSWARIQSLLWVQIILLAWSEINWERKQIFLLHASNGSYFIMWWISKFSLFELITLETWKRKCQSNLMVFSIAYTLLYKKHGELILINLFVITLITHSFVFSFFSLYSFFFFGHTTAATMEAKASHRREGDARYKTISMMARKRKLKVSCG